MEVLSAALMVEVASVTVVTRTANGQPLPSVLASHPPHPSSNAGWGHERFEEFSQGGGNPTSFDLLDQRNGSKAPLLLHTNGKGGVPAETLPADWHMASLSGFDGFCALPLSLCGEQLVAVLSLFWTSSCPVPPGLRQPALKPGQQRPAQVQLQHGEGSRAATAAELQRLQQAAQFLSFGFFSDASQVAYALKVARMLSAISRAPGLQAAFDAIMATCIDVVQHRCHLDLGCLLVVAHTALPSAAFVTPSSSGAGFGSLSAAAVAAGGSYQAGYSHSNSAGLPLVRVRAASGPLRFSGTPGSCERLLRPAALRASTMLGMRLAGAGAGGAGLQPQFSLDLSVLPAEPADTGPVTAHLTSMMHTLLQLAVHHASAAAPELLAEAAAAGQLPPRTGHELLDAAGIMVGGGVPATGSIAGSVTGGVSATGCIVPSCSAHLQDELLPCRDVVLCQRLMPGGLPVHALAMAVARAGEGILGAGGGSGGDGRPSGSSMQYAMASQTLSTQAVTVSTRGNSGGGVCVGAPVLAVYLTSADPLPPLVLHRARLEAVQLLQLALPTLMHRTQHSLTDEWQSLLDALSSTGSAHASALSAVAASAPVSHHSASLLYKASSSSRLPLGGGGRPTSAFEIQGGAGAAEAAAAMAGGGLSHHNSNHSRNLSGRQSAYGMSSGEVTSSKAPSVVRVDGGGGLQALDLMVNSIQSTLSAVQVADAHHPDTQDTRSADISGVELMQVIGRGGQGVVFLGAIHGIEAAVKVISHRNDDEAATKSAAAAAAAAAAASSDPGGAAAVAAAAVAAGHEAKLILDRKRSLLRDALELAVTSSISHPNIVQMYSYLTDVVVVEYGGQTNRLRLLPADHESLSAAHNESTRAKKPATNTVMCMEYCDAGTLKTAAEAGMFRQPGATAKTGPACPALVPLYMSLLEVALALRHLHSRRLVHVDLKPANVLLKSSSRDPRGWTCKLSDFGCVRLLSEPGPDGRLGFRQPQPLGTVTHMAPEMFVKGQLLDASVDIYSFGIVMWEMIMVAPLYDGTIPRDKLPSMIRRGLRPNFHPLVPTEYKLLATNCWADDPRRRPTAAVLVSTLQRLLTRSQQQAAGGPGGAMWPPPPASSLASPGPGPGQAAGVSVFGQRGRGQLPSPLGVGSAAGSGAAAAGGGPISPMVSPPASRAPAMNLPMSPARTSSGSRLRQEGASGGGNRLLMVREGVEALAAAAAAGSGSGSGGAAAAPAPGSGPGAGARAQSQPGAGALTRSSAGNAAAGAPQGAQPLLQGVMSPRDSTGASPSVSPASSLKRPGPAGSARDG